MRCGVTLQRLGEAVPDTPRLGNIRPKMLAFGVRLRPDKRAEEGCMQVWRVAGVQRRRLKGGRSARHEREGMLDLASLEEGRPSVTAERPQEEGRVETEAQERVGREGKQFLLAQRRHRPKDVATKPEEASARGQIVITVYNTYQAALIA